MKTTEMSSTLEAFAGLASADRAEELRKFAAIFRSGKDETVAARIKQIVKGLKSRPECLSYPLGLKESLAKIATGFSASKAKQAGDFEAIKSLFEDAETGASVDKFITRINEALAAAQTRATRRTTQAQPPDQRLVSEFSAELTRTLHDAAEFSKVLERLRDANVVPTPTLSAVANRFLNNEKRYSGRKTAIDDIAKRRKQDARTRARDKALDKIPV